MAHRWALGCRRRWPPYVEKVLGPHANAQGEGPGPGGVYNAGGMASHCCCTHLNMMADLGSAECEISGSSGGEFVGGRQIFRKRRVRDWRRRHSPPSVGFASNNKGPRGIEGLGSWLADRLLTGDWLSQGGRHCTVPNCQGQSTDKSGRGPAN